MRPRAFQALLHGIRYSLGDRLSGALGERADQSIDSLSLMSTAIEPQCIRFLVEYLTLTIPRRG